MRSITSLDITPEKMEATPYGLAVFGGGSENSPRGRARYPSRMFYDTQLTQKKYEECMLSHRLVKGVTARPSGYNSK